MAKVETFKCDQCGKQKQETNHWFFVVPGAEFYLYRWGSSAATSDARHLCGQACVVAELNSWMNQEQA